MTLFFGIVALVVLVAGIATATWVLHNCEDYSDYFESLNDQN